MKNSKISFEDFESNLIKIIGQPMSEKSKLAAIDFWENWEHISEGIYNNTIDINVDMLLLSTHVTKYKSYHTYKGLSKILFLISIFLIFFSWELLLVGFLISFCLSLYGNFIKEKDAKSFIEETYSEIVNNENNGMTKLFVYFAAGTIQLESNNTITSWPAYPSSVLKGYINYIE